MRRTSARPAASRYGANRVRNGRDISPGSIVCAAIGQELQRLCDRPLAVSAKTLNFFDTSQLSSIDFAPFPPLFCDYAASFQIGGGRGGRGAAGGGEPPAGPGHAGSG